METPFEMALQAELDKLPYERHVDDGMYNDGRQAGFELGARWALGFIETLLPTEEEIQTESDNNNFGWGWEDGFEFGAHWTKELIKSRLAGKEEK